MEHEVISEYIKAAAFFAAVAAYTYGWIVLLVGGAA